MMERDLQAVVLLNLGSPEKEDTVPAYIRSLLSDPYVMPLPWPLRPLLAAFIALRRSDMVKGHYRAIGGRSPLSTQTRALVEALRTELGGSLPVRYVFRHSPPPALEVLTRLAAANVRRVVAVPAYPQWSRSTSGSALHAIETAARRIRIEIRSVPAFPAAQGYIEALGELTRPWLTPKSYVLISAHGIPMRLIRSGDPYLEDVRKTVNAFREKLPAGTPHSLAFQSRVGRMEWTGPNLQDEVRRLAGEGIRSLVVVPISFVCENLETVYELDIELATLAGQCGITDFRRVATPGCHPAFIAELARLVRATAAEAGWEVPDGQ